jgi:hypothetical protein
LKEIPVSNWSTQDLAALRRAREIRVAGRRADGSQRTLTIVWHVVVDDALFVRSVRGAAGQWYRGVTRHDEGVIDWDGHPRDVSYISDHDHDEAIDAAYLAKYGNGSAAQSIMSPAATETTLRIEPR